MSSINSNEKLYSNPLIQKLSQKGLRRKLITFTEIILMKFLAILTLILCSLGFDSCHATTCHGKKT